MTERWRTITVYAEPFPPKYSEEQWEKIANAACGEPECGPKWWKWEIGFGSSNGILEFTFHPADYPELKPDKCAEYVARLLDELNIEAATIWARNEWTVMAKL